jgi:putative zinc finger/helix-turn-helix YgiT family protein
MNPNGSRIDPQSEVQVCFNCGSSPVLKSWQKQIFQYGSGESAAELVANVPVFTCSTCGFQFAGPEAEELRHEAVCRHVGVLTPSEIATIRERIGLGRNQFAERTGIGIASLKRWESGALIQNVANDALIYLMAFPDNLPRLTQRERNKPLNLADLTATPEARDERRHRQRFRGCCIDADQKMLNRAQQFRLRVGAK